MESVNSVDQLYHEHEEEAGTGGQLYAGTWRVSAVHRNGMKPCVSACRGEGQGRVLPTQGVSGSTLCPVPSEGLSSGRTPLLSTWTLAPCLTQGGHLADICYGGRGGDGWFRAREVRGRMK